MAGEVRHGWRRSGDCHLIQLPEMDRWQCASALSHGSGGAARFVPWELKRRPEVVLRAAPSLFVADSQSLSR